MNINVEVIPHNQQRYETVGDWWFDEETGTLEIRVSNMDSYRYHFLVAFHEQIEALLCMARGIDEKKVTEFDENFEANRAENDHSEPGDNKLAPYRKEHFFATSLERLMAAELGVDWEDYDKAVLTLL